MNRALRTAATGMMAQQLNVDTIAHNLANVNTTGFKKSRPEFQDLMYQTLRASGTSVNPNVQQPLELQVGNGSVAVGTQRSFLQGDAQPTKNRIWRSRARASSRSDGRTTRSPIPGTGHSRSPRTGGS
jgi:flagellar basal-body rod protein FlgG